MKKNNWTVLLFFVLLGIIFLTTAAKAQNKKASVFENRERNWITFTVGETKMLNEDMFQNPIERVVSLQGEDFIPRWTGLINISGTCRMKHPPIWMLMSLSTQSNGSYYVIQTSERVASFNITIQAEPVKFRVIQGRELSSNSMQCNITFQAVK